MPIEAERLKDNDLALEQFLSPSVPVLAGFRIDAFNVIRPRTTHSPFPKLDIWDCSTFMEDRYILPAVLYIQVSVVQVITVSCSKHFLSNFVAKFLFLVFS